MSIERFILIAGTLVAIASSLYIPRKQLRKAILTFLAFQATTWCVSILLVQLNVIEFPVREFSIATKVVFIPQFFVYPAFFTWFVFMYTQKSSRIYKALHCFISISIPVWFAFFIAVYTNLSEFTKGTWLNNLGYLYLEFALQYLVCFLYIKWFYKLNMVKEDEVNVP